MDPLPSAPQRFRQTPTYDESVWDIVLAYHDPHEYLVKDVMDVNRLYDLLETLSRKARSHQESIVTFKTRWCINQCFIRPLQNALSVGHVKVLLHYAFKGMMFIFDVYGYDALVIPLIHQSIQTCVLVTKDEFTTHWGWGRDRLKTMKGVNVKRSGCVSTIEQRHQNPPTHQALIQNPLFHRLFGARDM